VICLVEFKKKKLVMKQYSAKYNIGLFIALVPLKAVNTFKIRLHSTWRVTVCLVFPVTSVCIQPTVVSQLHHNITAASLVVMRSPSRVHDYLSGSNTV